MVKGGGCQPSVSPRTPARAPQATRAYNMACLPARNMDPAQPLALDVGSPRAAQAAGTGYFFASVRGSPHPTGPACSYDPCASKSCSGALASCAVRERQVAPSRCEAQGCAADGTADSPEMWRAATSASGTQTHAAACHRRALAAAQNLGRACGRRCVHSESNLEY
jgi:hypothetical protein